jgi:hypothetical protein
VIAATADAVWHVYIDVVLKGGCAQFGHFPGSVTAGRMHRSKCPSKKERYDSNNQRQQAEPSGRVVAARVRYLFGQPGHIGQVYLQCFCCLGSTAVHLRRCRYLRFASDRHIFDADSEACHLREASVPAALRRVFGHPVCHSREACKCFRHVVQTFLVLQEACTSAKWRWNHRVCLHRSSWPGLAKWQGDTAHVSRGVLHIFE